MFELILKTSIRNLLKNKQLSIINVMGLAMGITCALVIYLVVNYETQFDSHYSHFDKIVRIYTKLKFGEVETNITGLPYPMYEIIKNDVPQAKSVAQVFKIRGDFKVPSSVENPEEKFYSGNSVVGIDNEFFKVFNWEWLQGSPTVSFEGANSIVLTEQTALNLFGSIDVMGKELYLNRDYLLTVTGIVADPKGPTNFEFSSFVSHKLVEKDVQEYAGWTSVGSSFETLVLLDANNENIVEQKTAFKEAINTIYKSKIEDSGLDWKLNIQAMDEIHFSQSISPMTGSTGSMMVLWVLFAVAVMIVLTACINYINLSTAFATLRTKEIGVRKILGGSKRHLVGQFLGETFILVSIAFLLSFGLAELFLMYVSDITGWAPQKQLLREALLQDAKIYFFMPLLLVLITALAGLYPAFISATVSPLKAFKIRLENQKVQGLTLRRILVVFQFAICQLFVLGSMIVLQQLSYTRNKSLGFKKDHVMNITLNREDRGKAGVLKNRLESIAGVSKISLSNLAPITNGWSMFDVTIKNDSTTQNYAANTILAEPGFFDIYEFEFLSGVAFPKSDSMTHIVINQAFLKWLDVDAPEDAVGKAVYFDKRAMTITGVVADFHLTSLHNEIKPVMIGMAPESFQTLNIRVNPIQIQKTIAETESIWKELFPENAFKYNFLEDAVYRMYQDEEQMFNMFNLFAGLAVFISCLGLYGLVAFMSLQKTKEIGIRKVLGASVSQVVLLFSKEFIILVPLSLFIAGPLGYFLMDKWLSNFAYHISIELHLFLITLLSTMFIALLTVSYQSLKAASKNPIEALRTE